MVCKIQMDLDFPSLRYNKNKETQNSNVKLNDHPQVEREF